MIFDGKAGATTANQHEFLTDILSSGRHLLQLINDVLDLAKVESGRMDFFPEPVNLNGIVGEVCDILRSLAAKKDIEIRTEIDGSLSGIVIDPAKLKQLLYNYLSNALKFTPDSGTVTVRMKPDGNEHFILEVEDTGIGISTSDLGRLFVEFQQLDASTAKKYQGTGLGLALTKRIVEAQGGEVGVRSSLGSGSTFWARLSRKFRTVEKAPGADDVESPTAAAGGTTVLVIEDDSRERAWLIKVLSDAGYVTTAAANGAEAVHHLRATRFDVITLDILLPDMTAAQVMEVIRESELNHNTPVIAVSITDRGASVAFAVRDWLVKPVRRERLLKAVKGACPLPNPSDSCVLVVDDDPSSLKLARTVLKGYGYHTLCASDGEEGLKLAETEHPAAIVLDLVTDGVDGFEFLRRLRREVTVRIPVIVWSGKTLAAPDRAWLLRTANKIVPKGDGATEEILKELRAHSSSLAAQN
jgi:CheY-like chemotaxis protein